MEDYSVTSAETMIRAIRHFGIIPLFRSAIKGWSIEDLTPEGFWFSSSDNLGPWDWKIDAVRQGDIAYGKFIGGKTGFATLECYRHLMNWRRNQSRYLRGANPLADAALDFIRQSGDTDSTLIRKHLYSIYGDRIKKNVCDSLLQYLEMGTWTLTGDISRVYRGPNAEYSGWQKSHRTTPEALFGAKERKEEAGQPFWVKYIGQCSENPLKVECRPEESGEFLVKRIQSFFNADGNCIKKTLSL